MRLERLQGYLLRLPLKKEQRVSDMPAQYCETVFTRLESEGAVGWSEVTPGNEPYLSGEWSASTFLALRDSVAPRIASMRYATSSKSIIEALAPLKGVNYAKAAAEMAWQDLSARKDGQPLWKALGGEKKPIKVGLTFDRSTEREEFFAALARANEEQFARVTLKIRPGWDVQVISFARIDSPAHLQLQVDVEGALDFDMHADTLYRMDDFFLNCVEQPLNPRDFVAHAMLKDSLRTPVCLDESILSLEDAKIALDLEACHVMCMKPGRVGGLAPAREIAEFAEANDVPCYAGFEMSSSLGYRALLALASTSNFTLPTDYMRFSEVLEYDPVPEIPTTLIEEPGDEEKGRPPRTFRFVELWDEPGLGVEPDLEALKPYILDQFEVVI